MNVSIGIRFLLENNGFSNKVFILLTTKGLVRLKTLLPNPIVVFESTSHDSPYLRIITDSYTTIDYIDLTYCCQPNAFNVLKYNDNDDSAGAVHSYCQLPYSCFDEFVSGAVDMYIT